MEINTQYFQTSTWSYSIKRLFDANLTQIAASLTYTTILAIVPLLTVILSVSTVFPAFKDAQIGLQHFLQTNLFPEAISDTLMTYINQFVADAGKATAMGLIFLVITSLMFIRTITLAFNQIWRIQTPYSLFRRIISSWAVLTIGPLLIGIALSIITYLTSLTYFEEFELLASSYVYFISFLPTLLMFLCILSIYMILPNTKVLFKDAFVGSFVCYLGLFILKEGFALYLSRFNSYQLVYGAFAVIPIFLIWVYLCANIILLGAIIAATLPEIRIMQFIQNNEVIPIQVSVQSSQFKKLPQQTINVTKDTEVNQEEETDQEAIKDLPVQIGEIETQLIIKTQADLHYFNQLQSFLAQEHFTAKLDEGYYLITKKSQD
ncbi:MAG: YihY family inner membrane protein [Alcaligenaceae bacterium]|nr:YihY family inner membrane protein [Alcaligenaceae bacterium]